MAFPRPLSWCEADRIRVAEMPLRHWNELDGLSERAWRRVLERGRVGRSEFEAKD